MTNPDCSTALGYCLSYSSLKSCGLVRSQQPEFEDIKQFTITPIEAVVAIPLEIAQFRLYLNLYINR